MPTSNSDDDLLAQELGKVGALGGNLGGSRGARFAAKFLPTETYSEEVALNLDPGKATQIAYSVLSKLGKIQRSEDENPPYPLLKAIVGSGFLNMNPAVTYLEILDGNTAGCKITITAAAKEGLIKQNTAAKAVRRIATALRAQTDGA